MKHDLERINIPFPLEFKFSPTSMFGTGVNKRIYYANGFCSSGEED